MTYFIIDSVIAKLSNLSISSENNYVDFPQIWSKGDIDNFTLHIYRRQLPRENEGTERDSQGVGWDMSIPRKLFLTLDGNGRLFPQTSV